MPSAYEDSAKVLPLASFSTYCAGVAPASAYASKSASNFVAVTSSETVMALCWHSRDNFTFSPKRNCPLRGSGDGNLTGSGGGSVTVEVLRGVSAGLNENRGDHFADTDIGPFSINRPHQQVCDVVVSRFNMCNVQGKYAGPSHEVGCRKS